MQNSAQKSGDTTSQKFLKALQTLQKRINNDSIKPELIDGLLNVLDAIKTSKNITDLNTLIDTNKEVLFECFPDVFISNEHPAVLLNLSKQKNAQNQNEDQINFDNFKTEYQKNFLYKAANAIPSLYIKAQYIENHGSMSLRDDQYKDISFVEMLAMSKKIDTIYKGNYTDARIVTQEQSFNNDKKFNDVNLKSEEIFKKSQSKYVKERILPKQNIKDVDDLIAKSRDFYKKSFVEKDKTFIGQHPALFSASSKSQELQKSKEVEFKLATTLATQVDEKIKSMQAKIIEAEEIQKINSSDEIKEAIKHYKDFIEQLEEKKKNIMSMKDELVKQRIEENKKIVIKQKVLFHFIEAEGQDQDAQEIGKLADTLREKPVQSRNPQGMAISAIKENDLSISDKIEDPIAENKSRHFKLNLPDGEPAGFVKTHNGKNLTGFTVESVHFPTKNPDNQIDAAMAMAMELLISIKPDKNSGKIRFTNTKLKGESPAECLSRAKYMYAALQICCQNLYPGVITTDNFHEYIDSPSFNPKTLSTGGMFGFNDKQDYADIFAKMDARITTPISNIKKEIDKEGQEYKDATGKSTPEDESAEQELTVSIKGFGM